MILVKQIHVKDPNTSLTEYTGLREEMVASNVATDAMFPNGRKNKAYGGGDTSRDHWIMGRIRGGKFRLRMWRSKDNTPAEPAPYRTESETDFRESAVCLSESLVNTLTQGTPDSAYCYDTQSLRAIRTHAHRLLEAVANGRIMKAAEDIKCGEVVYLDQWR